MKKNHDRGFHDLALFEIGPVFFGKKPGEQQTIIGAVKSGKLNKKAGLKKLEMLIFSMLKQM